MLEKSLNICTFCSCPAPHPPIRTLRPAGTSKRPQRRGKLRDHERSDWTTTHFRAREWYDQLLPSEWWRPRRDPGESRASASRWSRVACGAKSVVPPRTFSLPETLLESREATTSALPPNGLTILREALTTPQSRTRAQSEAAF